MTLRSALERDEDLLFGRAVRSADAAEAVIRSAWDDLLDAVRAGGGWAVVHRRVRGIVQRIGSAIAQQIADDLARTAYESHDQTARTLLAHLKPDRHRNLLPLLLLPLAHAAVHRLVFGTGWPGRLGRVVREVAPPDLVASQVATALHTGAEPIDVARLVRPAFQLVQTSARRIARDEGMRAGHQSQHEVYERLGERVEGFIVLSMRDDRVRPKHRARHGQRYYRHPKAGQLGYDRMPRPPYESPAEGGKLAHGCRCHLYPIIDGEWLEV